MDPENLTVNAVLIAMASVVGLALLLNCRTWWQVADSVLNSQRKRLHSAADNLHKLKSEGFMKVWTKRIKKKTMNFEFCKCDTSKETKWKLTLFPTPHPGFEA